MSAAGVAVVDRKSGVKPEGSPYEVGDWIKVIDGNRLHLAKIVHKSQYMLGTYYTVSFPGMKTANETLTASRIKCHTVSPEEQPPPPPAMYKVNEYVTLMERDHRYEYGYTMTGCIITGQITSVEYHERVTESEWLYHVRRNGRYDYREVPECHILKSIPPPVDINKEIPELKAQMAQINQTLSELLNVMKGMAGIAVAPVKK